MTRLGVGRSSIWKPLAVVLAMGALLLAPVAAISLNDAHTLDAPIGPLTVWGYVYDLSGQPLEGANVVVTVVESGATSSGVTDFDGKYQATPEIDAADYDIGYTIRVVASYNSNDQENTSTVPVDIDDIGGLMQVDVHYTYEVPEFGTILGFLVAAGLVGMIAVYSVSKRKGRNE